MSMEIFKTNLGIYAPYLDELCDTLLSEDNLKSVISFIKILDSYEMRKAAQPGDQPAIILDGHGRTGKFQSLFSNDLRFFNNIWARDRDAPETIGLKKGDKLHSASVSGATPTVIETARKALNDGIPVSCMTSVPGDANELYLLATAERIYVPRRNSVISSDDPFLAPMGNLEELGIMCTNQGIVLGRAYYQKKKSGPGSDAGIDAKVESYLDGLLQKNIEEARESMQLALSHKNEIEAMLYDTADVEMLLVCGIGRAHEIAWAFDMRFAHGEFAFPWKEVKYLSYENLRNIGYILDKKPGKKVRAIILSEDGDVNPCILDYLGNRAITTYLLTCDGNAKGDSSDRIIKIPVSEPCKPYYPQSSVTPGYKITPSNMALLPFTDALACAVAKVNGVNMASNHK